MTIKHLPEPQFLFQNGQLWWWSRGIAGFQVAACVGQEVLHRSPRCKNSRHFSKKEKLNTNYPKQKVVFICICICVEILSTLKLSQQNCTQYSSSNHCNFHPRVNCTQIDVTGPTNHHMAASPIAPNCWILTHLANMPEGFKHLLATPPLADRHIE